MTAPSYAPFDTNRVENLVTGCLNAIVSAAAGFSPAVILPARQISGAGPIPYDCEQVFATVLSVGTGTPEPLGLSGVATWPTTASGANYTLYNATLTLAILRNSAEKITGMGTSAPAPALFGQNLGLASQDIAVLQAALAQIGEAQSSATPRTESVVTAGGLIATTCRLVVLV